jgi:hypothetical protein
VECGTGTSLILPEICGEVLCLLTIEHLFHIIILNLSRVGILSVRRTYSPHANAATYPLAECLVLVRPPRPHISCCLKRMVPRAAHPGLASRTVYAIAHPPPHIARPHHRFPSGSFEPHSNHSRAVSVSAQDSLFTTHSFGCLRFQGDCSSLFSLRTYLRRNYKTFPLTPYQTI